MRQRLCVCGILLAGLGCDASPGNEVSGVSESSANVDFERLSFVLNRLRQAGYDQKAEHLARLTKLTVTTPEAVNLKKLCVEAYTVHEESVALLRQLGSTDGGLPEQTDDARRRKLDLAEGLAERARQLTGECARLEHARR